LVLVVYACRNCGYILDVVENRGIPRPEEVAARYRYRCPRCGAPLLARPYRVVLVPSGILKGMLASSRLDLGVLEGAEAECGAPG
jgi:DNA-directed RNA polymerase subunit RPC12/RpoP